MSKRRANFNKIHTDATLMDLPKALQEQAETFREMTNVLKKLSSPETMMAGTAEFRNDPGSSVTPTDDLLAVANQMLEDPSANNTDKLVECSDDICDAVRSILNQTAPQTDFGEKLQEVIAKSFARITNPESSNLVEDLKARFKVPENCKELGVAKVNPEIWAGLPQSVKNKDAKSQHLQQHMSRALIAQAKTAELIMQLISKTKSAELQPILKSLMDSAMSVGLAVKEINATRKYNLRPSLLPEYAGLASANLPVTQYLFGDNLDASLKLMKSTSKIVKPSTVTTFRYRPYPAQSYRPNLGNSNSLNFRRQSFRGLQPMTGSPRPNQWRNNQQVHGKFKKFQHQPRQ